MLPFQGFQNQIQPTVRNAVGLNYMGGQNAGIQAPAQQNRIQPYPYQPQQPPPMQPDGGLTVGIEPWQMRPPGMGQQPGGGQVPPLWNFMARLGQFLQGVPQQNQAARQGIMDQNAMVQQQIVNNNEAFRAAMPQPMYRALPVQGSQYNKPMWNNSMYQGGY